MRAGEEYRACRAESSTYSRLDHTTRRSVTLCHAMCDLYCMGNLYGYTVQYSVYDILGSHGQERVLRTQMREVSALSHLWTT